ncbi:MAG: hypothetical protein OXU81_21915 [Gammaproteobacteria bacterium]|nr:hypothetical protein [Gammaproteobacteria bacterium]
MSSTERIRGAAPGACRYPAAPDKAIEPLLGEARYVSLRVGVGDVREKFGSAVHGFTAATAEPCESAAPWSAIHGARRPGRIPVARCAIDIEGVGAHGARPEASVDPVVVASHLEYYYRRAAAPITRR